MITKKILRTEDDPTRRGGGAQDEQKAVNELTRPLKRRGIIGPSKHSSRSHPNGNRRTVSARPAGVAPRPRWQHKKDFRALGDYLLEGEKQEDGSREYSDGKGRVETVFSINVGVGENLSELTPDQVRDVADWMGATAALNTRIRKSAVVHYVMSLPEVDTEKSSPEFWRVVAPRVLQALDMEAHEALFVVHKDTDNPHMHVMINRVHPQKETAVDPLRDLIRLEALNRELEKELGLKCEPGRHIDPKTGKTYDWDAVRRGEIKIPGNRKRMTRVQIETFSRQAKKDLADKPFSLAQSWTDLERQLSGKGYSLRAEGRGMKLCKDGQEVKLTKIAGKGNGREKLEGRFGNWNNYQADIRTAKTHGLSLEEAADQRLAEDQRQEAVAKAAGEIRKAEVRERLVPMLEIGVRIVVTSEDPREPAPGYLGRALKPDELRLGLEALSPDEVARLYRASVVTMERVSQDQREMLKMENGRNTPAYFGAENARINLDAAVRAIKTHALALGVPLDAPQRAPETGTSPESTTWKVIEVNNPDVSAKAIAKGLTDLSDEALFGHLEATRRASQSLQAVKRREGNTPERAGKSLRLAAAARGIEFALKERGLKVSKNSNVKARAKSRGMEM